MTTVEAEEATFVQAIRHAQDDAMRGDETIVLLGQDVAIGFPFGATSGLQETYGAERVRDTPISEAATMGCGVGLAIAGMRPVVEVDFSGFLLLGLDQLVNNGAKARYLSDGQVRVPLVLRVGQGPLGSFGAQHSQVQHGWLMSVPGLAVCAPSTAQDAYDLMRWALRQADPVVFAEDMRLYNVRGPLVRHEDPVEPSARAARVGQDVTVLTFGFGVIRASRAAETLAQEGIELEILDLPMLAPLVGRAAIAASVAKTGRVLCIADDPLLGGITASLAMEAIDEAAASLRAPVLRLGARHAPAPYNRQLEQQIYPSAASIETAVRQMLTNEGA